MTPLERSPVSLCLSRDVTSHIGVVVELLVLLLVGAVVGLLGGVFVLVAPPLHHKEDDDQDDDNGDQDADDDGHQHVVAHLRLGGVHLQQQIRKNVVIHPCFLNLKVPVPISPSYFVLGEHQTYSDRTRPF